MSRSDVVERIDKLCSEFDKYVAAFDKNPPFSPYQLTIHQMVINRRLEIESAEHAINDDHFLRDLRQLLAKWGMDVRSAELVEQEEFKTNIRHKANEICALEKFTIEESSETFAEELVPKIIDVITNLNINCNISKVVVGSKALHHILPELIPPIDRSYTGRFFSWYGPYFQYRQQEILREGLIAFNVMARECRPERLVGPGWRTSQTKILDNAIAGYCILENLPRIA